MKSTHTRTHARHTCEWVATGDEILLLRADKTRYIRVRRRSAGARADARSYRVLAAAAATIVLWVASGSVQLEVRQHELRVKPYILL